MCPTRFVDSGIFKVSKGDCLIDAMFCGSEWRHESSVCFGSTVNQVPPPFKHVCVYACAAIEASLSLQWVRKGRELLRLRCYQIQLHHVFTFWVFFCLHTNRKAPTRASYKCVLSRIRLFPGYKWIHGLASDVHQVRSCGCLACGGMEYYN